MSDIASQFQRLMQPHIGWGQIIRRPDYTASRHAQLQKARREIAENDERAISEDNHKVKERIIGYLRLNPTCKLCNTPLLTERAIKNGCCNSCWERPPLDDDY